MTLTEEQIQTLFRFCEKKRIVHYDLQVEIVDHLANAIEERMEQDGSLLFEDALMQVHQSFGPLGLRSMTATREAALQKKYSRMKWQLLRSYFTWPKFAFTLLMIVIAVSLPRFLDSAGLAWAILSFVAITFAFIFNFHRKAYRMRKQQTKKLLMTHSSNLYYSPVLLAVGMQFSNVVINYMDNGFSDRQLELYQYGICAVLSIVYFLFAKVRSEMLTSVYKKASEEYPLAFAK